VLSRIAKNAAEPYERPMRGSDQHVAVIGDSSMYGPGVKDKKHTISGLLAARYPKAIIETRAINGSRVRSLQAQLCQLQYTHYDLVLVGIGGNDIVRFSSYRRLERELYAFLEVVSEVADEIILCSSVNIGNIGFFLFPFNLVFDYRTYRLSRRYGRIANHFPKVRYANFYRPRFKDHYDKNTRKQFLADDAFHPNEYANRYFFELIWEIAK
jgi:lysophospholipase L1-like esterase